MAEGEAPAEPKKVVHIYPLVKESDMSEDMRNEAIELIVTACEKYAANNEMAANLIKEQLDKKFGPSWHVLVGEGFGFDISYEVRKVAFGAWPNFRARLRLARKTRPRTENAHFAS